MAPDRMTGEEFKSALKTLNMETATLINCIGVSTSAVQKWRHSPRVPQYLGWSLRNALRLKEHDTLFSDPPPPRGMTPKEFEVALAFLEFSKSSFARVIGVDQSTVHRWLNTPRVPQHIAWSLRNALRMQKYGIPYHDPPDGYPPTKKRQRKGA